MTTSNFTHYARNFIDTLSSGTKSETFANSNNLILLNDLTNSNEKYKFTHLKLNTFLDDNLNKNEIIKQEFVDFRHDRYGEKIIKGSKKHKIVFIDKLKNNCNLVEKIDVVSYKNLNYLNTQHERDQSSRCKIGMCCFLY